MDLHIKNLHQMIAGFKSADNDQQLMEALGLWQLQITRMRNIIKKKEHPNRGKAWTHEQETHLLELFSHHMDHKIMETTLGRSWRSLHYHLSKLLLEEEKLLTRAGLAHKYQRTEEEIAKFIDPMHNKIVVGGSKKPKEKATRKN